MEKKFSPWLEKCRLTDEEILTAIKQDFEKQTQFNHPYSMALRDMAIANVQLAKIQSVLEQIDMDKVKKELRVMITDRNMLGQGKECSDDLLDDILSLLQPLIEQEKQQAKIKEKERIYEASRFTIHTSGHAVIIDINDYQSFLKSISPEKK